MSQHMLSSKDCCFFRGLSSESNSSSKARGFSCLRRKTGLRCYRPTNGRGSTRAVAVASGNSEALPGLAAIGAQFQKLSDSAKLEEIGRLGERTKAALQDLADYLTTHVNQTQFVQEFSSSVSDAVATSDISSRTAEFLSNSNETLARAETELVSQLQHPSATIESLRISLESLLHRLGLAGSQSASESSSNIELIRSTIESFLHEVEDAGAQLASFSNVELLNNSTESILHRAEDAGAQGNFQFNSPIVPYIATEILGRLAAYPSGLLYQLCTALGVPYSSEYAVIANIGLPLVGSTFLLAIGTFAAKDSTSLEGKDLPSRYDPDAIEAYFKRRSLGNTLRSLQVLLAFSSFGVSLLADKILGVEKENEAVRATELVNLITSLGPTAIKIGQALSIRPDLLPVTYLEELQKLQDKVPPFSNDEAKALILEGLGKSAEEVFAEFSAEPVAAASLGQVYKAKLRESGDIVAVKVQRPGVLEGICRDLYLLRNGAQLAQSLPNVRSDLVALVDNWAFRFFDELDYVREGENALQFAKNMESLPNILVPSVYMKYTSRKVLTTHWVEGEKLSESKADDLLQLVKVALNCYLMQLLESGFLHADPHPGNLLRTQDGCLCVLDYGLMTQITTEQQYAFIDYISHLVNADYALVAEDLIKLGFVPPELVDPAKTFAVVPQLSRVLGQLVQGGGARKLNFQQITDDLSSISRDYVFVVPPYFALILRAFSVLEGIGLAADPDYAIVDDCFPYLCKRLITDDSPRARAALKYFVYAGKDQLDVSRVENIISGFQSFQKLIAVTPESMGDMKRLQGARVDFAVKEVLYSMFARGGSYLQELLLTELVRAVDALSRDAVAEVWQYFVSRTFVSLPPSLRAPKSWPIFLPGFLFGSGRVATLSIEDQQALETVKRIWVLIEPQLSQRPVGRLEMQEAAGSVIPLISDLFPGVVNTSQKFILMLLQRQALRLADDLDGKDSVAEWNKDPSAFVRKIRPIMGGP